MPATLDLPDSLVPVMELVQRCLVRVESRIGRQLASGLPAVEALVSHVEHYRGKMLRPSLAILCGLAAGAREGTPHDESIITDDHIAVAAVCEMIHLATLVHDDVLDEADTRRGGASVNRLHGNERAVILGDYLFSAAYHLCSGIDDQSIALLIGKVGMTLCAGELLQLHHREDFSLDEPTYVAIVERKTASLIAAACRLGAVCSGASADEADRFERFGSRLGVAFQIQDDLLDLTGDRSVVGKPLGKDAEKGKLTLAVIHHLASATPAARGRSLALLHDLASGPGAGREELLRQLESTGSVAHARRAAEALVEEAKGMLAPAPESPARALLLAMADHVVTRVS